MKRGCIVCGGLRSENRELRRKVQELLEVNAALTMRLNELVEQRTADIIKRCRRSFNRTGSEHGR